MNTRKERLQEVYEYVRKHFGIHTKKDFAEKIGMTLPAMYSAFSGKEEYLTESLMRKVSSAFPGVFNLIYLIDGQSELLTLGEIQRAEHVELCELKEQKQMSDDMSGMPDYSSMINALIAANSQTIEALKRESAAKDETIEAMQVTINEQADHIKTLKGRLNELRQILDSTKLKDGNYPFPMGVADQSDFIQK